MYSQALLPHSKSDAVSHNFCLGCGLCALNCPSAAIVMEEQALGDYPHTQIRKSPSLKQHLCVHCGRCAAVCPSGTIVQFRLEELLHKVQQSNIRSVAFFCTALNPPPVAGGWQETAVSELADLKDMRMQPRMQDVVVPERVLLEEVRCTGRLGARFVLRLVLAGVREVVFFSCGRQCQYAGGGTGIVEHVEAVRDTLTQYGLGQSVRLRVYPAADLSLVREVVGALC